MKILKTNIVLMLLVSIFSSCNDNVVSEEFEYLNNSSKLLGKWKLVESESSGMGGTVSTYDYSSHNFIYDFKSNGIVTISGPTDANVYPSSMIGDNSFSFEYNGDYIYQLEIGYSSFYSVYFLSGKLNLDNRPLDGSVFRFVKVK